MTQERNGFSSALRAASMIRSVKRSLAAVLTVAVIASLTVVGTTATSYAKGKKVKKDPVGMEDSLVVSNNGSFLNGSIVTFPQGAPKHSRPIAVIGKANGVFFGAHVPAYFSLSGVAVDPNPLNLDGSPYPVSDAIFAASDLSLVTKGAPDIVAGWAPGALGTTPPIAMMITVGPTCVAHTSTGECEFFVANPMSIPQGFAFIFGTTSEGEGPPPPGSPGNFYVTQYAGEFFNNFTGTSAPGLGAVNEYLPYAGTGSGDAQFASIIPVGQIADTVACTSDGAATGLLGPVGVALDSSNNIWVVNSGFGSGTSYVTEYPAGSASNAFQPGVDNPCVVPIDIVNGAPLGYKILEEGVYDAISPVDGTIWVSDLKQNAVFEFDPVDGDVLTTIAGKHTRLKAPMGIVLGGEQDSFTLSDDLYVVNNARNEIDMFEDPAFSGLLNEHPSAVLNGARTQLIQPVGITLVGGVHTPIPTPTATSGPQS